MAEWLETRRHKRSSVMFFAAKSKNASRAFGKIEKKKNRKMLIVLFVVPSRD